MKRKYRKYSDEDIVNAVKSSKSIAQVLKKLDLLVAGGNYANIQKNIRRLGVDTSHFLGQAINLGQEIKSFDSLIDPDAIKKRLLKERGFACEACRLSIWNNRPIALELEHVDGNRLNNLRINLKLLCPNCHAQTSTWRRQKKALP